MDKIQKFLSKLTKKDQDILSGLMILIKKNTVDELDVKKLVGEDNLYRVRKGNIRIIYRSIDGYNTIINIDYRGSIYK